MEAEGSLPHLYVPATYPYSEPDQSSPFPKLPLPEDPSTYYPPIYSWVFHVISFPKVSHQNLAYTSPHTSYMAHPPHSSQFDHPK